MKPVDEQIQNAISQFCHQAFPLNLTEEDVTKAMESAFISGASLTAHFIAANDGSPAASPGAVEQAIARVAGKLGMERGKL